VVCVTVIFIQRRLIAHVALLDSEQNPEVREHGNNDVMLWNIELEVMSNGT